ncbi:hypothetical protein GCM10020367_08320 [Streptomyces sannanensis]|uniref:Uncharacterized protein n=1 Tax=Streptomyces sannanensis TaxID=285536 RepID=A0ABP6S5N8_9ACTN
MLTAQLPGVLRKALGPHWEFTLDGDHLTIEHPQRGTPYHPPRHDLPWLELLATLQSAFADTGVPRAECLPLRWGRETELTISAVQALDPYLKHRQPVPYRQGFLPQPVVRLTGQRDEHGNLRDGFLTAFVNASRIQTITDVSTYGTVLDEWLTVLSRLSLHARHITIHGNLKIWRRRQVAGITLRYDHASVPLGDIVLLWNADDPTYMAVDLGTALERLSWVRSRRPWHSVVHGDHARHTAPDALDAIRTATLLLGSGIPAAQRGPGATVRRMAGRIQPAAAMTGLSQAIRIYHTFWSLVSPLADWPSVAHALEGAVLHPPPRSYGTPDTLYPTHKGPPQRSNAAQARANKPT